MDRIRGTDGTLLSEEHSELIKRAEMVGVDTYGYKVKRANLTGLRKLVETAERKNMEYVYILRSSATPEDSELVKELGEVCEAVLARLADAIELVTVMDDSAEMIENDVREQVSEWAANGWLGNTKLAMPDDTFLTIHREEVIKLVPNTPIGGRATPADPRGEFSRRTGMGYPDSPPPGVEDEAGLVNWIMDEAIGAIQWVIDDLRSWESNPESAGYNADKLAGALALVQAYRKLRQKGGV